MAGEIRTVDFKLDLEKLNEQLPELLRLARPDWSADEEISYTKMSGGVANSMFSCNRKSNPDDKVVVRVYLSWGEGFPDRDDTEIIILKKVRPSGFGPRMLLIFKNGLCYEYIKGRPLNVNLVRSEQMLPLVTKTLASLHSIPVIEGDIKPFIFDTWLEMSVKDFPPDLHDETRNKMIFELIPDQEFYRKELDHMKEIVSKVDSPIVFSHNDPKAENFIWDEEAGTLTLIDFEMCSYNSQAYDVSGVFVAYNDICNGSRNTYPDKEHQYKWIKMYLEYWYEATGRKEKVTENDIEKLHINANKWAQMCRLAIGVGCLYMISQNMHDCFDFSLSLIEDYFKYKDEIDALHEDTLRQEKSTRPEEK